MRSKSICTLASARTLPWPSPRSSISSTARDSRISVARRISSAPIAAAAGPTASPARASSVPRLSTTDTLRARSPGTAPATRFTIACTASRSSRPAPTVVSITEACASCLSRAKGSRRGSTRWTRAARTPEMVRMERAISPSSARVSAIFCWNWLCVMPSPRSSSS